MYRPVGATKLPPFNPSTASLSPEQQQVLQLVPQCWTDDYSDCRNCIPEVEDCDAVFFQGCSALQRAYDIDSDFTISVVDRLPYCSAFEKYREEIVSAGIGAFVGGAIGGFIAAAIMMKR